MSRPTTNARDTVMVHRARQEDRGRHASGPTRIPLAGWKDVLWRVYRESNEDRVMLIAAGATFYLLLALFPALAAFVSIYGVVANPQTIADHIAFLGGLLPSGGMDLIQNQIQSLAAQGSNALSFGFITGLLIALWSANSGIKTLFDAMNIAYEEEEKRSFIKRTLVSLTFTLGAILIGILFLITVGLIPAVLAVLNLGNWTETLVRMVRWPVMVLAIAAGISLIYSFGPSRERPKMRWLTWGAALATVVWIAASIGFSYYLENFATYNATYGTLGAVIGFMMWMWISVIILLMGAELNAEIEHQTVEDTTTGAPQPIGHRGARMADTIGKSVNEEG
jgi:membrane protein